MLIPFKLTSGGAVRFVNPAHVVTATARAGAENGATCELLLSTGHMITVEGTTDDVAARLAAKSLSAQGWQLDYPPHLLIPACVVAREIGFDFQPGMNRGDVLRALGASMAKLQTATN